MKIRKLSFLGSLVMVVVLVSLTVLVGCKAAPAKVYEWKIQSVWARGDLSMETLAYFAERVEERSNGRLKIKVFAEPELVPLPEVFPATSQGTLDMAQGGGAIWSMVVPCGDVVFGSVPRLWDFPDLSVEDGAKKQRQFLFESGAVDILRREYAKHNLYWLDMHTAGSVCHLSTKEVHTLADIKGLKMADLGGWMAQWHAALGWVPVEMLPASDMEMALRLGTIDCLDWDLSAIAGFGWYKVAPYWVSNEGMVTHILQDMLVNMDSWNALPDDLKQALAGAAEDYFYKTIEAYSAQREQVMSMVKAGEVIECLMDKEYERAADEAAYEVWDKAAAEDPASAELIKLIKEFRGIK
jgi:TRAP-type mannitol/chloroaromatic compound transport system substrate-binding protein